MHAVSSEQHFLVLSELVGHIVQSDNDRECLKLRDLHGFWRAIDVRDPLVAEVGGYGHRDE